MGIDQPAVQTTAKDAWALGFAVFAGVMMMMIGILQVIAGFATILNDEFYRVSPNYVFEFDAAVWGWVRMLLGIVVGVAGYAVFAGLTWARVVGITVAVLSAVGNFVLLPQYPFWGLSLIALNIMVIWALTVYLRPYRDV